MAKTALRAARRLVKRTLLIGSSRSDYGKVWNLEARTQRNARLAVAGFVEDSEWERSGRSTADDVAAEAAIGRDDVVIEIGCGAGRVGKFLAPRCGRWIGADVSSRMLDFARRTLAGQPNVTLQPITGHGLSGFPDASADVVYCTGVFMHLEEWDRYGYVLDAFGVLKPGGRIYFDNFNLLSAEGWALFEQMRAIPPGERPLNISKSSTPEELRVYAERAGFEQIRVRTSDTTIWATVNGTKPGPRA